MVGRGVDRWWDVGQLGGGTKMLQVGTKMLQGGTKILRSGSNASGWDKHASGGTNILRCGTLLGSWVVGCWVASCWDVASYMLMRNRFGSSKPFFFYKEGGPNMFGPWALL